MEYQKMNNGYNAHSNTQSLFFQGMNKHNTIGVVIEVVPTEMRVALTPNAVRELTNEGQTVYVQTGAGMTASFTDEEYRQAGATMIQTAQEVYQRSQIMMKVQMPTTQETQLVQPQQTIFCFMTTETNNQTEQNQTLQALNQRHATVFLYEWMQTEENTSPVMNALSEVSGDLAVQQGMRMMETKYGGKGKILGQVAGEEGARVLIIGSGVAAMRSAKMASAIGAQVTVMDINTEKLRELREQLRTPVQTMTYSVENLEKILPETQLLIGAVIPNFNTQEDQTNNQSNVTLAKLYSWTRKPLINGTQMMSLQKDAVAIDLAKVYGGNFENTKTFQVTEEVSSNGVYTIYAPTNITSTVPNTASKVISNSALPFVKKVATLGWKMASVQEPAIRRAAMMADGQTIRTPKNNTQQRMDVHSTKENYSKMIQNQQSFQNNHINFEQEKAITQLLNMMNTQKFIEA